MSEVRQVIRDARRDVSGTWHGSMAERLVAALSAEPETIEELDAALARFIQPDCDRVAVAEPASGSARPALPSDALAEPVAHRRSFFGSFSAGIKDQPWDAGVVVVDLAARLVVYETKYASLGPEGYVTYHDGHAATEHHLRYHLPDDWMFVSNMQSDWRSLADTRRSERLALPPLDVRDVVYGRAMIEFVATECLATFQQRDSAPVVASLPTEPPEVDRRSPAGDRMDAITVPEETCCPECVRGQETRAHRSIPGR